MLSWTGKLRHRGAQACPQGHRTPRVAETGISAASAGQAVPPASRRRLCGPAPASWPFWVCILNTQPFPKGPVCSHVGEERVTSCAPHGKVSECRWCAKAGSLRRHREPPGREPRNVLQRPARPFFDLHPDILLLSPSSFPSVCSGGSAFSLPAIILTQHIWEAFTGDQ